MTLNKKNKQIMLIGGTLIIVAVLIATTFILVYQEKESIKDEEKIEEQDIIDDRISPLTNQGVIIEILRIRHRGLLDKLMTPGLSWKNKPTFYFITDMDGVEYVSKNVQGGAAQKGTFETYFTDWDTMFQENKILRKAEEEQETSEIKLIILENVKTGLLKMKSKDIEQERIEVTYDYRTGRWTGDDSFGDSDGYGHYLGETFEVWFNIYQTDKDHDGIPYWTEVNVLKTDPWVDDSKLDPDNDGIPTAWEWKWGYDPHTWDDHMNLDPDIDGIENIEEYKMQKYFADPYTQNIYIEVDGMEANGLLDPKHYLTKESQHVIMERYSQHGITVVFDDGWADSPVNGGGELLPHYEKISQDSGMMLQFYSHHFADERKGIFRYCVIGHKTGFCHPQKFNSYDVLTVGGALKAMIINKKAFTPRLIRLMTGSTILHELGHSVGISPWTIEGCDNFSFSGGRAAKNNYLSTWGNYKSVMNYYYIYDHKLVDYSDGSNGAPYDTNDWANMYLPTFQIEARVFEEAFFEPPCVDKIVDETIEFEPKGWTYSQELSENFTKNEKSNSFIENVEINWFVFEKTDSASQPSERNIRVYAQPDVYPTYAEWTLSYEGNYNQETNEFEFYSD